MAIFHPGYQTCKILADMSIESPIWWSMADLGFLYLPTLEVNTPALCSVLWISPSMAENLVNVRPGRCKNSPHSTYSHSFAGWGTGTSCIKRGRRVQIFDPRGRKSRPTRASRTLDFPLLWLLTVVTCGRSIVEPLPNYANMSYCLFITGITDWSKPGLTLLSSAIMRREFESHCVDNFTPVFSFLQEDILFYN